MAQQMDRRKFFGQAAAGSLAMGALLRRSAAAQETPAKTVVVGVMGLSRGRSLMVSFAKQPGVVVKYVCDPDQSRAESGAKLLEGTVGKAPQIVSDFRRILDDAEVDVLICAAPNHWHAPATILACAAGKHVYVEKPCCQNPYEGELMVQAARKHNRAVQMGSQRRSGPGTIEAMQKLREGVIGRVYLAAAGTAICGPRSASANPQRSRRDWTTTCGKAPRRGSRTSTTASRTTGTGSGIGATASWATTESTPWTCAAGAWAPISRSA